MSQIMTSQTSLKKAFWKKSLPGLIALIVGASIIFTVIIHSHKDKAALFIGIISGMFILGVGINLILRNRTFLRGAKGEKLVSQTLANFPDDWFIFNDVIIRDTQIDHVLVCPKGIYAIETKHYRGTISGNAEDHDWWQLIWSRQIQRYNPVRQTRHHATSLANYLREDGYSKAWVEPLVVFSHPEVKLEVRSSEVPVITLSCLTEFLNNRPEAMNSQECHAISTTLNNYLVSNIKKNRLLTRWLPASLIIVAVFGILWWLIMKPASNQKSVESTRKDVISWKDADQYAGKIKTVQGKIINTYKDKTRCFLNFTEDDDKNILSIVIFSKDFDKFPSSPDVFYTNKVITVEGKIKNEEWGLEIIVNSPNKITIEK